jgi:hypothetical protein
MTENRVQIPSFLVAILCAADSYVGVTMDAKLASDVVHHRMIFGPIHRLSERQFVECHFDLTNSKASGNFARHGQSG